MGWANADAVNSRQERSGIVKVIGFAGKRMQWGQYFINSLGYLMIKF
jgi:hypothetical protein